MTSFIRIAKALVFLCALLNAPLIQGQCNRPYIRIDGNRVLADNSQTQNGLTLPLWLRAGQSLEADQNVVSISVLEFTVSGTTLEFSQVLSVTASQTVPAGKVWKVESIIKGLIYTAASSLVVSSGGTFNWTVPSCVNYACIEIWGAGGGGGGGNSTPAGGGGGGGGAYGYQCFTVTPGSTHAVTIGIGGAGAAAGTAGSAGTASSVGSLISAGGGAGGINGAAGGTPGTGGTSTASYNIPGGSGAAGSGSRGGGGGISANGGVGGASGFDVGAPGQSPGGGGAGGGYNGGSKMGGSGGDGKVIITW